MSQKDAVMRFILVLLIVLTVCTMSITNLDVFRLRYILSHNIGWELVCINPFLANMSILYPQNTPPKQNYSSVFKSYKMGAMARNSLI